MAVRRLTRLLQDIRRTALHDAVSLDDGQLLDHFIEQQDDVAFAALVQRHSAMVWGVCRRVLAHHHDAEDAFQATFLVLARKAASVRPRAMVANWLYGVAHRTALKAKAIAGKRRTREKQVITMPEPEGVQQDYWHNLEALIDQELAALPVMYRVVILLCDLEGKTGREVARQLTIPEGTLASRLRTGRLMLAKRLARHGFLLSGGALASVLSKNAGGGEGPRAHAGCTAPASHAYPARSRIGRRPAALDRGGRRLHGAERAGQERTPCRLAQSAGRWKDHASVQIVPNARLPRPKGLGDLVFPKPIDLSIPRGSQRPRDAFGLCPARHGTRLGRLRTALLRLRRRFGSGCRLAKVGEGDEGQGRGTE